MSQRQRPPSPATSQDDIGAASEQEYLRLSQHLRRLARRLVDDESTAEDVVQEAWLAALDRPDRVRDLNAWLAQVVRNLSAKVHRRRLRRQDVELLAARGEGVGSETDLVERISAYNLLRKGVLELREPYRTALELRFFQERSVEQVAEELGLSTEAVRSRVRRGVEALRERLDREHEGRRSVWAVAFVRAFRPGAERRAAASWLAGGAAVVALLGTLALFWTLLPDLDRASSGLARDGNGSSLRSGSPGELAFDSGGTSAPSRVPVIAAPPPSLPATEARVLELSVRLQDGRSPRRAAVRAWNPNGLLQSFQAEGGAPIRIEVPFDQLDSPAALPDGEPGLRVQAVADDEVISLEHFVPLPPGVRKLELRTRGPSWTIRGRVLDEGGQPVGGARVLMWRESRQPELSPEGTLFGEPTSWKSTASDGTYELRNLPPGEQLFIASKAGLGEQRTHVQGERGVTRLDFTLSGGSRIEGTIRTASGAPAVGARVWAPLVEGSFTRGAPETKTDDQGRFTLGGFRPGRHHVFAQAAGDPELFASGVVEAPPESNGSWDATLQFTTGVHVLVEEPDGAPGARAYVFLISEAGSQGWAALAEADEEGHAHVAHVPEGELFVIARRFGSEQEQSVVEGVQRDEGDVLVILPQDAPTGRLVGLLPPELAGVTLTGERGRERLVNALPDAVSGRFELRDLAPGRYRVWATVAERGAIDLGAHEVNGAEVDLGLLTEPERIPVTLDWGTVAVSAESPWVLEALTESLFEPAAPIANCTAPRTDWELYPGTYALKASELDSLPILFEVADEPLRVQVGG